MQHIYIPHPNEWKLKIEEENKQKKIRYEINPEKKRRRRRRKTTPWESHQIIAGPGETEHHPQTFHFQTVSLLP